MNSPTPETFDAMVERVIDRLPAHLQDLVRDTVPVIVQDRPSSDMLADLGMADDPHAADELLGLHTGVMLTEASVEDPAGPPTVIHLFRVGLIEACRDEAGMVNLDALADEIRVTILHELGHHFGLDETDLADLGYD